MDIKENAAYLKGLFDGYDIDKNTKEAKLMGQMLDLMMKMSERMVRPAWKQVGMDCDTSWRMVSISFV